jgi:CDGSH-type Zn-finger protein
VAFSPPQPDYLQKAIRLLESEIVILWEYLLAAVRDPLCGQGTVSKIEKRSRASSQERLEGKISVAPNTPAFKKPPDSHFGIRVSKDGPYIVTGGVPLTVNTVVVDDKGIPYEWKAGKNYPIQKRYELCRCGKSTTEPFCDNIHARIDFDGTETASLKPFLSEAVVLKGPDLTLTDLPKLCVHAGFCDRLGGTWALTQYSDTPEARRLAIEQSGNCPSGRLVVWDKEGHKGVSGPLWVRGRIPIESAEGITYEVRNRVALCRCGKSTNKPFCDGTHLHR